MLALGVVGSLALLSLVLVTFVATKPSTGDGELAEQKERLRETQRDRERDTEREREKQRDKEKETETETEILRESQRER